MAEETINVFCANEQKETPHSLDVDSNQEIILTCNSQVVVSKDADNNDVLRPCGRFIKYPAKTTAEDLKKHIQIHKESNIGQVSIESLEKQKKELLEGLK